MIQLLPKFPACLTPRLRKTGLKKLYDRNMAYVTLKEVEKVKGSLIGSVTGLCFAWLRLFLIYVVEFGL